MIIYKITNLYNSKIYIGQTVQKIGSRKSQHLSSSRTPGAFQSLIAKALRKYGACNFEWEVVDTAETLAELNEKEAYWIYKMECLSPRGYNLDSGGGNKRLHSSTKEKIKSANIGKKYSKESKIRRSRSYGIKPFYAINLKTEARSRLFETITEAAVELNITNAAIAKILNKEPLYYSAKGYTFVLEDQYNPNMKFRVHTPTVYYGLNVKTGERFQGDRKAILNRFNLNMYHKAVSLCRGEAGRHSYNGWTWRYSEKEFNSFSPGGKLKSYKGWVFTLS